LKINPIFLDIETTGINTCKDKIIAIGVSYIHSDAYYSNVIINHNENDVLNEFYRKLITLKNKKYNTIIGWKIVKFDIPFILMRSIVNKIDYNLFKVLRYFKVLDLAEVAEKYLVVKDQTVKSRDFFNVLEIEYDEMEGESIPHIYKVSALDRIEEHCNKDLKSIKELYDRLCPYLMFNFNEFIKDIL